MCAVPLYLSIDGLRILICDAQFLRFEIDRSLSTKEYVRRRICTLFVCTLRRERFLQEQVEHFVTKGAFHHTNRIASCFKRRLKEIQKQQDRSSIKMIFDSQKGRI
jgi:hypothetical protein